MLLFRLTIKTYLSPQLLVCIPLDVPVHTLPVDFILSFRLTIKIYPSTFLHVHKCTCSSLYLFSLFLLFWYNMYNDLLTHLLGYLHTDPPENTFYLFTIMLLFRLTTQTYLSPQLLVYLPIDVPFMTLPVHFHTVFLITVKIYLSTFLLFYMSTYVPVYHYTCSSYFFFFGITFAMTFQLIYWGSYTHIHPNFFFPVYLHASRPSNHKDLPVSTAACVPAHRCTRS